MPFRRPRKVPQFADLKVILAQTRSTENPLYQVIQEMIDRLDMLPFSSETTSNGNGGGGGGGGNADSTYLTQADETAVLPNSRQLLARYGLKFDDLTAGKRIIDLDLEYLGFFTAGPLYSDGDIVVAADNIAYLCVKPTNDAPVTWPGVGIATVTGPPGPPGPPGAPGQSIAVDATYWTVSPHAQLTNERAMNQLTNGYVRSTFGEPSVVATIPLTDTTGILPDNRLTTNVALRNVDNFWPAVQSFRSTTGIRDANAQFFMFDTAGAPDTRIWRFLQYSNGNFQLERINDAITAVQTQYTWTGDGRFFAVQHVGGGAELTNLHAPNITTGIVNTARLGTGTANTTTFLRGDNTWQPAPGVPSGLIAIFDTACPLGWTRVTALDNRFPLGGTGWGGTGGSDQHSHGFSANTNNAGGHSHGVSASGSGSGNAAGGASGTTGNPLQVETADPGSGRAVSPATHQHDFSVNINIPVNVSVNVNGNTDHQGEHSHSLSGATDAQNHMPPYLTVVYCRKD